MGAAFFPELFSFQEEASRVMEANGWAKSSSGGWAPQAGTSKPKVVLFDMHDSKDEKKRLLLGLANLEQ